MQRFGVVEHALDLVAAKHVAHEQVARRREKVSHVLGRVAEREAALGVERGSVAIAQIQALGVVGRSARVERAQPRLPGHQLHRVAARTGEPARVEQPGRGLQLVHESLPGFVIELDHRGRFGVTADHLDRITASHVGVGRTRTQTEGERRQVRQRVHGGRASIAREKRRQRFAVVVVGVERWERVLHGRAPQNACTRSFSHAGDIRVPRVGSATLGA